MTISDMSQSGPLGVVASMASLRRAWPGLGISPKELCGVSFACQTTTIIMMLST